MKQRSRVLTAFGEEGSYNNDRQTLAHVPFASTP